MHFDFTVHFWTLLSQVLALIALVRFLVCLVHAIRSMTSAANLILEQHKEMHKWYIEVKDKPWPHGALQQ
jgi:hypothetical protein